jgi:hypothetical protein
MSGDGRRYSFELPTHPCFAVEYLSNTVELITVLSDGRMLFSYYHEFDRIVTAIGEVRTNGFMAYILRSKRYSRMHDHMGARR